LTESPEKEKRAKMSADDLERQEQEEKAERKKRE
jgi:hypothetical protein